MPENIYPLRTVIGKPLPIVGAALLAHSDGLVSDHVRVLLRGGPQEVEDDPVIRELHPAAWLDGAGNAPLFGAGVRSYRTPTDLPVGLPGSFASMFILGPEVVDVRDGRTLWAEIGLELIDPVDKALVPLVGGLIVAGYPYLPSYLSSWGEPAGNHGYPRELRLSWYVANNDGGFIDDDVAQTQQLPAWQSSHHVITVQPVRTRKLRLRVSDLGRSIHTLRAWDPQERRYRERWAMALPLIYGFSYEEGAVGGASLGAGMVSATQSNRSRGASLFAAALESSPDGQWDGAESAWVLQRGSEVYPFTPQSALVPEKSRRRYPVLSGNASLAEFFVSNDLAENDRLYWLLAQRDEHPRCVAGLRLEMVESGLRDELGIPSAAPLRLQVYEVDPLPGSPTARIRPDLARDRFSRLLADQVLPADAGVVTVRFGHVASSRYLYLVLTARGATRIAVRSLSLIRSATATLGTRPSRSRQLRAVHFRLIGEHLGEDYARIGRTAFSIAIDRVAAGETKERLFQAHSLEELVRTGAARLLANSRVRAVEVQETVVEPGSFSESVTTQRSDGWQRTEAGRDVEAPPEWQSSVRMAADGQHGFEVMGNEEARTFVRHVANVPNGYRRRIRGTFESLRQQLRPNADLLWQDTDGQSAWPPWRTNGTSFTLEQLAAALEVKGLWNVSIPPFWAELMDAVNNKGDMGQIETAIYSMIDRLFIINGAGASGGWGVAAVIPSRSWSNNIASSGVATALAAHSIGTTGAITKSARQSGYSYAQNLTAHASEVNARTDYTASRHRQTLTRSAPADGSPPTRFTGAEVMWNKRVLDIVVGTVPVGLELPATEDSGYRTTDEAVRVSFTGVTDDLTVDAWFEAREELVRDDD